MPTGGAMATAGARIPKPLRRVMGASEPVDGQCFTNSQLNETSAGLLAGRQMCRRHDQDSIHDLTTAHAGWRFVCFSSEWHANLPIGPQLSITSAITTR